MSEKEKKSEHDHKGAHASHPTHKRKVKIKVDRWKIATFVFAILFIISWFTGGFSSNDDDGTDVDGGDDVTPVTTSGEAMLIIVNDKRCAECGQISSQVLGQLKGVFPNIQSREIDYNDKEGQEIYNSAKLTTLPAFLFTSGIENEAGYSNIANYMVPQGEYKSLRVGANYDPSKEICDNGIDDTDNGKVDCADSECSGTLLCREEIKKSLQVFIMSDCPYGRKAIEALKPVVDNANGELEYEVHYIASQKADGGFSSLHGQYEVDENIVQLCAFEYSPDAWFDYLYCRSTKGVKGVDWKTCAAETGVDVDAVQSCFDGDEGAELLTKDIQIAKDLGISGSPTWITNNKYKFSGIDSETVRSNVCKYNDGLAGCENVLSTDTGGVAAGNC